MATTTATKTSQSYSHTNGALKINGASVHDTSYVPRGPVTTTLNFFIPPADGSLPFNYVEQPPEGQPQRNFSDIAIPVEISDIRGQEHKFTLDQNAFEALKDISSEEHEFADDSHIKKVYYPEVEKLILDNVPGSNRVLIFDHTIRRGNTNANASRGPVTRVHIDQTFASAKARVRHHLPDEADALLKSRYRIINVWRPINGAVESFPLGFADSSSVRDEDVVGVEHRYPDRTGETAGVKHRDSQKWYYWSGMTNDERLLLKCSDSDEVVRQSGGRVPHTAFVHPRSPEGAKPRESIEVRALVFG